MINRVMAQKNKPEQPKCLEIKRNIQKIQDQKVKIDIQWVSRDQGITWNEKANQLTNAATEGTTRDHSTVVSRNDLRNQIRREHKNEWDHQ